MQASIWTDDLRERLRALIEDRKMTPQEASLELGINRNKVVGAIERFGFEVERRRVRPALRAEFEKVIDLVADEDLPLDIAAQTVGVPLAVARKLWADVCAQRPEQNV